jgi:hypothetical protein
MLKVMASTLRAGRQAGTAVGDDVLLRCDGVHTAAPRGLCWPIVTTPMTVLFDGGQLFSFEGRRKWEATVDGPRCFMSRYKYEVLTTNSVS